ncbi:hypothetical protein J7E25_13875 [Agromyces sp. ISL-38]|uniref:hypothetical protein n=1 Tax=Agromyces sp. ISL-38 TaxID=2819107 RepID=UPI001BE5B364|nr:hypothetical protein [Agromyces sp. ISL-38]MBT2500177.1 hypothetical protein [Agromyces sp. ISL-38]
MKHDSEVRAGISMVVSDRDVAVIANAQRHVPLRDDMIEHFRALGVQPAELYGAVQYLATLVTCDPRVRSAPGGLAQVEREQVLDSVLVRLRTSVPLIAAELLRDPSLITQGHSQDFEAVPS